MEGSDKRVIVNMSLPARSPHASKLDSDVCASVPASSPRTLPPATCFAPISHTHVENGGRDEGHGPTANGEKAAPCLKPARR